MTKANLSSTTSSTIDEGLYSRQLYALGHDAMKLLSESNILVIGLNGLGVEISKNIILSGVKSVTLYDDKTASLDDLGTQYYVTEETIGTNLAEISLQHLKELNPHVNVSVLKELPDDSIGEYDIIVLTNETFNIQNKYNILTRKFGKKFIGCSTYGLFGQIFCDFNDKFVVKDADGEEPKTSFIMNISNNINGLVTCTDTKPHQLSNGDYIIFSEIEGMTELNDGKPIQVKIKDKFSFTIGDTTKMKPYINGGIFIEQKQPQTINFLSFAKSVTNPSFIITDMTNWDRAELSHYIFQALDVFVSINNRLPKPHDKYDANDLLSLVKSRAKKELLTEKNLKIIELFSKIACGSVCPMQSVIGSIVAQEVIKASSGKFTPINQWMYFDSVDSLPPEADIKITLDKTNNRYQSQMKVFGSNYQKLLENAKIFVVGTGAIGCELMKNFAMMGIGNIVATDMDTIERSNLNRQFLFRNKNIGQSKSLCAKNAINIMNPLINIEAHQNKVSSDTEQLYNEEFFDGLTCVANALDNVIARKYMDDKCVENGTFLLESGTLGSKGNVQVIVPHLTESYGSSQDPPEQSVPVCTLKNFPNEIDHTIQYARELFEQLFKQGPLHAMAYLKSPTTYLDSMSSGEKSTVLLDIKKVLENIPKNFSDCINFAVNQWQELYHNQISQLLVKFPADHMTDSGIAFWSGIKKCPTALRFNINNDTHYDFVLTFAYLWALIFDINPDSLSSIDQTVVIADCVNCLPKFIPKTNIIISVTEDEEKKRLETVANNPDDIKLDFDLSLYENLVIKPIEFEKDSDTNGHMEFITNASNLRAMNYNIPVANKHKTKGIAGKIIPALATTTSLVAGLVSLELYKVINHKNYKPYTLEQYRNSFLNLAIGFIGFSEPIGVKKSKFKDHSFSLWDNFVVKNGNSLSVGDFLDYFDTKYNFDLMMISLGSTLIFSCMTSPKKQEEVKAKNLIACIKEKLGSDIKLPNPIKLSIVVDDGDDGTDAENDYQFPDVKLYY